MKIHVYTSYPNADLGLWDNDDKLPKYSLKISEFVSVPMHVHPQRLFNLVYAYLLNAHEAESISDSADSSVVVIIAYSEVIFNACRVFLHDAASFGPRIPVNLTLHVVDDESELFAAQVTSIGKICAPKECDLRGVFDCYDSALDRLLDI